MPLCAVLWGLIGYTAKTFPDRYYTAEDTAWTLHCGALSSVCEPLTASRKQSLPASASADDATWLKLWGVFPVKEVTVRQTEQPIVALGGTPFGIKLYTDGVLLVGLTPVEHTGGSSPAKAAGLRVGDLLLSIDGQAVATNEEVAAIVAHSGGKTLSLRVRRDGVEFDAQLTPAFSQTEGAYKAGMWVRDSSAGIGTMTFYDPSTGVCAGLGHAVCDVDTGEPLPISGGELLPASVFGVIRGTAGAAGELRGCFEDGSIGPLYANVQTGVFGVTDAVPDGAERLPLAMKQQVVTGAARVYTTVQGQTPDWYDVEIVKVRYYDASPTQNMVIRITDARLLEATGGIVQGMSGSPIVQNGRLIGAVTHVFVGDPTQGFAVFAENMYRTAQSVGDAAETAA